MADIVTRLLLNTKDFDANLDKSKSSVDGFQGGISNMAKAAGAGVLKFAGAIGVVTGAAEIFTKTMSSSQTTGDAWASIIGSAKASVDEFFTSLSTGDFTGFLGGMDDIIGKAKDAISALDQLGNTRMSYQVFSGKNATELEDARQMAQDKGGSMYGRQKGFEYWNNILLKQEKDVDVMKETVLDALRKSIVQGTRLNSNDVGIEDFEGILRYDLSDAKTRDKLKGSSKKGYEEYTRRYAVLEERKKSGGVADWAFPNSDGAKEREAHNAKISALQEELNAEYKQSILYNQLLVRWEDEKLQSAVNLHTEYKGIEKVVPTQRRTYDMAYNRFQKELGEDTGGMKGSNKTPMPHPKKANPVPAATVSIAALNEQIAIKNKELINATTVQARIAVQSTIDELEARKINLQIETDKGAFAAKYGENKLSQISSSEMAGVLSGGTKKNKGANATDLSKIKLSKYEPIFKKEDIDLNNDFADSLSGVGEIMGRLSGLFDENTNSTLQWGASLLTAISQAMPAIIGMMGVKEQDTATTNVNTTAEVANAGAKAMSAHSGIPFVGIALGLAGVAAIIAAMSSMPRFASGGIVPGASFTGDKVPALLNSGEMILNGSQQGNLFNMLNSGAYDSLSRKIMPLSGSNEIRLSSDIAIKGDTLYLTLNNYLKKTGKKL